MSKASEPGIGDRVFLGIRGDRLAAAAAIAFSAALLLCGYEIVRSVSNSLFNHAYGAQKLPIVMALGPVATLLMIYGYGRLLSVTGPRTAILTTTAVSMLVVLGCCAGLRAESKPAAAVLYVFREAYVVLLIEQVWSFINSTVRTEEGSKLNGPICGVASLGAIAGDLIVNSYAKQLGSANLLLLAAATFVPTGLLAVAAYRAGGEPKPAAAEAHGRHGHLGVRTLVHHPILWRLALLIACTQVVSTMADLQLNRYVERVLPIKDLQTEWWGGFLAKVNIGSAVCQFIVAPLLLAFVSHRIIHVAIPLVHLGVIAAVVARPGLWTAQACYLTFKVLDYSVFRAVKELLYIPLSFDARYRAKEMIDAFTYRASKGATAALFIVLRHFVTLATYPSVIVPALAGWLVVVLDLTRADKVMRNAKCGMRNIEEPPKS